MLEALFSVVSGSMLLVIGGGVLNVMVLPTLWDKEAYVPRFQSVPSAIALAVMTFGYIDQSLIFPAIVTIIGAVLWAGVALYRNEPN